MSAVLCIAGLVACYVLAWRASVAMHRTDANRIAAEWAAARRSLTVVDVRYLDGHAATTCAPARGRCAC